MTTKLDTLERALEAADIDLADYRPACPSCHSRDCKDREKRSSLIDLFWDAFGCKGDREGLRLDAQTIAILLSPDFPRFERGASTTTDHDSDVLSEIANLGLADADEAAAIAWHMAAGRPDREHLADEAAARWVELHELARELAAGSREVDDARVG